MTIIKCKMCGGDIELTADKTFGTCEFCGSTTTLPRIDDEQRAAAFNRGNHFRRIGEFDKALAVYERIIRENDTDAEAHWCAALCRFGIEYVEDPATYEWIPTCHRASFDSFLEDVDYKAALEYSDGLTRRQYLRDGAKIAEVQRGILATSQNTEPYDVFICYKESDDSGNRTRDSLMAQDIYYQLTDQGHRVFFSRITLEDVVGAQYEPYIFAALNSAKVMVAVGTKPEHFSAVWVKNEWSRFLALMRKDHSRVLLPCYRDMDPYDLPEALSVLQSYDMSRIGFIQDLIRGVDKVVKAGKNAPVPASVIVPTAEPMVIQQSASTNTNALVKRGNMALEDSEWKKADDFFEQALNQDAELAGAYLGKFLAENCARSLDDFAEQYLAKTEKAASVKKEACPKNKEAEHRAVEQYTIPGYLEAHTIRGMFAYDRTYTSVSRSREEQLDKAKQLLDHDKNLKRTEMFRDEALRMQIEQWRNSILTVMEDRFAQAKKDDADNVSKLTIDYRTHVENTVCNVLPKLQKQAEHEKLYMEASELMEDALSAYNQAYYRPTLTHCINMLNQAAEKFDATNGHKDSTSKSQTCKHVILMCNRRMDECCVHCGGSFKGWMTRVCVRCGKPKDY